MPKRSPRLLRGPAGRFLQTPRAGSSTAGLPPNGSAPGLTRRAALAALLGAASLACTPPPPTGAHARPSTKDKRMASGERMPALYIPHGGGPWPFVDGLGLPGTWDRLQVYLENLGAKVPRPKALLVVSAHWEEEVPTVMTAARPPMLYDYYGFPPAAYTVQWPAPGAPDVAARAEALLNAAGVKTAADDKRGFDHGTFVPLKLTYPAADIPTTQLSLVAGLDPATHIAVGRALAPLRDEGVLIVGSGMSFHNMRAFRSGGGYREAAQAFDQWLQQTVKQSAPERDRALAAWDQAPGGRASHPREEHLLPLMVIAGAAGDDRGEVPYTDELMGHTVSAVHFG